MQYVHEQIRGEENEYILALFQALLFLFFSVYLSLVQLTLLVAFEVESNIH